jgi:integrase
MSAKRRTRVEPGIYTRPDGRYEIGYRDAQGRQRWRVVEGGIAAARKQLTAAKAQRDRGDHTATNPRLTFDRAADEWLAARVSRLAPNTQTTYAAHLKHLRKRFGRTKLAAIASGDVARYVAELERAGVPGRTQRGRLAVLSGVFTYAGRHLGHAGASPVSLLDRVERPSVDEEREHHVLTGDDLNALLAAADDDDRLMFVLAAQTGARKGEVLGLTWHDIDVPGRTLHIDRQLDRWGNRSPLKTKRSRRTVAVSPALAAQLAEHRLASGAGEHDLVFRRHGRPYTHGAADRALRRALKRAGMAPMGWHELRHSHVSVMFAAGHDAVAIAARIGDSVETVLRVYAHEYDAARRRHDESDKLGALYDRSYGSAVEARGSSRAQQTASEAPADLALARAKAADGSRAQ